MDISIALPIGSAVIALAALGTAIWQGYVMREHNKLSVLPRLNIDVHNQPGIPVKIELKNQGLGPAIINKFRLKLDNKEYKVDSVESMDAVLKEAGLIPAQISWRGFLPSKGTALLPGDSVLLLEFSDSHFDENQYQESIKIINRIDFSIKYRSIYGEVFDSDIDH
jgi:hypothetical protein